MKNLTQKIPTLRITIALATGFLIADCTHIATGFQLVASAVLFTALVFLNKIYRFNFEALWGWLVYLLFIEIGITLFTLHNSTPRFYTKGTFWATVLEVPEEKPGSYKSLVQINAVKDSGQFFQTKEKVLVYFEKDTSAGRLRPGNTILFSRAPEILMNNGNPYEFDYKKYLSRKKIYRRIYLRHKDWRLTNIQRHSLKTVSENTRERLLKIYRNQNLGTNETEILSALTLGYKRGLDPETKRTFSAAGAMHVLAVSGLHVGIIFGIFTLLFGFLKKRKKGKYLYIIMAVAALWAYAFITGLSPSVMRAAAMFSLVCIAANIHRKTNIYNTLTVSALILLLQNPNNLFEVGFQLSYAAVFGIVYLQPKLFGLWQIKNKLANFFWTLLTVSIAAQIATFPLTAYYFNQFPSYFWLSNLIVIPAVFVLISLSIALLVFSSLSVLASFFAVVTDQAVKYVYLFLARIENLPFAVTNINLTKITLGCVIALLLFAFLYIEQKRIQYIKLIFVMLILLVASNIALKVQHLSKSELIVYNNASNPVMQLINGKNSYVISERPIDSSDYILRQIENVCDKQNLTIPIYLTFHQSYFDDQFFLRNGILRFSSKNIWIDFSTKEMPMLFHPDFIISTKSNFQEIPGNRSAIYISNAYSHKNETLNIHVLQKEGAFRKQWKTNLRLFQ